MKITFESEESKCTVEDPTAVDIFDAFQLIKQGLLGIGFHPNSVKDAIESLYDEQVNNEEKNKEE